MSAAELADRFGTPLYVYDAAAIRERLARLRAAFGPALGCVHYSVKANPNRALLQLLAEQGAGFDVVSGGELERCVRAGIDPARLVFAGVGKRDDELALGLERGVGLFDVESAGELTRLAAIAAKSSSDGRRARFALRVNPDVDAGTHAYVTTGTKRNKFGMSFDAALAALVESRRNGNERVLDFRGLHFHIGSQVTDPTRFGAAARVAARCVERVRAAGFPVALVNLGGGFAAGYEAPAPPIEAVAKEVVPLLAPLQVELLLEPGRFLVAEAGTLLTRVIEVKPAAERPFVIVDAAMNDLIRPALYQAWHPVELVADASGHSDRPRRRVDIVGPVCESADFLALDRELPEPRAGDLLAIGVVGAYGMSMASNYNSRGRAAEVLVDAGAGAEAVRLIGRRETIDDLLRRELP